MNVFVSFVMYQLHGFLTQLEFSQKVGRRNYYNLESTQKDENFLKNQQNNKYIWLFNRFNKKSHSLIKMFLCLAILICRRILSNKELLTVSSVIHHLELTPSCNSNFYVAYDWPLKIPKCIRKRVNFKFMLPRISKYLLLDR